MLKAHTPSRQAPLDLQAKIGMLEMKPMAAATTSGRVGTFVRAVLFSALAALLAWGVVTRTVTSYVGNTNPDAALRLRPDHPSALLNLAAKALHPGQPTTAEEGAESAGTDAGQASPDAAGDQETRQENPVVQPAEPQLTADQIAKVGTLTERALAGEPLSARAMRFLGQVSAVNGDQARAAELMRAASRRSLQESLAHFWMMRYSWSQQDFRAALAYADTLLRTRPELIRNLVAEMGQMADHATGREELKLLLATNPPWRSQFLRYLPSSVSDARTPLDVLMSLSRSPHPPTFEETSGYLSFLVSHKFYDLAYYTWLQFLPPEQLSKAGRLFNGGFDFVPSGSPFDWTYKQLATTRVKIAPPPDRPDNRALLVEFEGGRSDFSGVAQLVQLPPGNYQFEGQFSGEFSSGRGLLWTIGCAGSREPFAKSEPLKGSDGGWRGFAFQFSVPDECPAQYVKLILDARSESQKLVSGSIWHDDLQIVRH